MYLLYEQVDVTGVVQDISALNPPTGAIGAMLQAQSGAGGGDINFTFDGTQPGASRGMVLQDGLDPEPFLLEDVRNIKFCKSAGDTKLNVSWFGGRSI